MNSYEQINATELKELIQSRPVLLVDTRDSQSYLQNHLPGAISIMEGNLHKVLKHMSRNVPVVVYCKHGVTSQDYAQLFSDFGFHACYNLTGGIEQWFASEYARKRAPVITLKEPLVAVQHRVETVMHDSHKRIA
ncbi:MAG: thiosulfate sulfurtransferase GlpE [Pseudomonadales bacterium]|nr:thiosulfate sulfurtransferase GlpE [Pseudomonadales bacterium]